mmetsp:Transcript_30670/g.98841  ORF Transcript_30670/g.98841 Transcript_30670/m.98841 type:complete len:545 (-) Transcript_30670:76-1710(-)
MASRLDGGGFYVRVFIRAWWRNESLPHVVVSTGWSGVVVSSPLMMRLMRQPPGVGSEEEGQRRRRRRRERATTTRVRGGTTMVMMIGTSQKRRGVVVGPLGGGSTMMMAEELLSEAGEEARGAGAEALDADAVAIAGPEGVVDVVFADGVDEAEVLGGPGRVDAAVEEAVASFFAGAARGGAEGREDGDPGAFPEGGPGFAVGAGREVGGDVGLELGASTRRDRRDELEVQVVEEAPLPRDGVAARGGEGVHVGLGAPGGLDASLDALLLQLLGEAEGTRDHADRPDDRARRRHDRVRRARHVVASGRADVVDERKELRRVAFGGAGKRRTRLFFFLRRRRRRRSRSEEGPAPGLGLGGAPLLVLPFQGFDPAIQERRLGDGAAGRRDVDDDGREPPRLEGALQGLLDPRHRQNPVRRRVGRVPRRQVPLSAGGAGASHPRRRRRGKGAVVGDDAAQLDHSDGLPRQRPEQLARQPHGEPHAAQGQHRRPLHELVRHLQVPQQLADLQRPLLLLAHPPHRKRCMRRRRALPHRRGGKTHRRQQT